MGNTWITDMRHFLDSEGFVIQEPRPARLLAEHFCSIVEAVTRRQVRQQDWVTGVQCRRRPGRKACAGKIIAGMDQQDPTTIVWSCPLCGDNGYIRGWQETQWDKRSP